MQCQFLDGHGQLWTVLRRDQLADPSTGKINCTRVIIRRFEKIDGQMEAIFKTIRCAGPVPIENQYEMNRPGRPPRAQRLPFEPATPVGS
ncbi:hypothetical protein [Kitasatospora aureofaciens]|uniref:hypothetical protein n=1 Tax=Kitasatospora aureofaciens TaxID=1894 RepID=UPI0033FB6461